MGSEQRGKPCSSVENLEIRNLSSYNVRDMHVLARSYMTHTKYQVLFGKRVGQYYLETKTKAGSLKSCHKIYETRINYIAHHLIPQRAMTGEMCMKSEVILSVEWGTREFLHSNIPLRRGPNEKLKIPTNNAPRQ